MSAFWFLYLVFAAAFALWVLYGAVDKLVRLAMLWGCHGKPRQPARFKARVKMLVDHAKTPVMFSIPPIVAGECELVAVAYHGGRLRTAVHLVREALCFGWRDLKWKLVLRTTDAVGWTKMYHFPETASVYEHWMRHGRQCSGSPNCQDHDCVKRGVPAWFRFAVNWEDDL